MEKRVIHRIQRLKLSDYKHEKTSPSSGRITFTLNTAEREGPEIIVPHGVDTAPIIDALLKNPK